MVILNVAIIISGKFYLYKLIANTLLKGRMGPSLTEYLIFDNREVKTGIPQPSLSRFFGAASMPRRTTVFRIMEAIGLNENEFQFDWMV